MSNSVSPSPVLPSKQLSNNKRKRQSKSKQEPSKSLPPQRFVDNESLSRVSSIYGMVDTRYPSTVERDVVLDRFKKEIIQKFQVDFHPGKSRGREKRPRVAEKGTDKESGNTIKKDPSKPPTLSDVAKSRLCIGTNQCTRILEGAMKGTGPIPSLLILARDLRPPHMLAHVPVLAKRLTIPLLLLPGKTSRDLATMLGVNMCAIVLFRPRPPMEEKDVTKDDTEVNTDAGNVVIRGPSLSLTEISNCHRDIESFIEYAKSKIP